MLRDHKSFTWYCLFEIEVKFCGYVYLVSSGSLFEPLISTMTKTWVSSYFGNFFSSLLQNNYHVQCHNSLGVVGIQEVMYVLYSMDWIVEEYRVLREFNA